MDYYLAVSKIYQEADFNPACFNFSEAEAREKKLWRDPRPMPTAEQINQALLLPNKEALIKVKYDLMVKEIYDELFVVFGTSNDVSAQATASTYEAMKSRPANYVGMPGLANEAAVIAFANAKILLSDNYAKFRLNRIAQYQAEKAAILNG